VSGCDDEWRSHNSRRKARVGGAGGAMRGRTGEARQPEALAGRGELRWLPGAGGRGMTRRLRPERGELWAFFRETRGVPALCMSSVGEPAPGEG
jgi:hypothetical protein